jgi:hypothetical protein
MAYSSSDPRVDPAAALSPNSLLGNKPVFAIKMAIDGFFISTAHQEWTTIESFTHEIIAMFRKSLGVDDTHWNRELSPHLNGTLFDRA